ncbi:hypothetical protein [Conyzicola sp.]|uniref:hypothetical protein n=1 Tax=Conyzicola sp. TaxID=1969404 RepID=UPI003988A1A6
MTSLIRQRQLILGERNSAVFFIALGALSVVIMILASIDAQTLALPGSGGVGVAFMAMGAFRLRAACRKLAAFEAEHGVDAGKQQAIR